jgi:hypothetical protein
MIHRWLGSRLACALVAAAIVGSVGHANACLTTTCAVKNPPASCVRDPATLCWLAGNPLQWKEACVSFSVDQRGIPTLGLGFVDTEAMVTSSFALWPTASCEFGFPSISVKSAGALACSSVEYNQEGPNSNAVIFQTQKWPHDPLAIGVTTVTFDPESGRLVDADMEVNLVTAVLDFADIRYVVAHEAGHFFGLDHSALEDALMFARSSFSQEGAPLALTPDDQNAICLAYPTARPVGACDFEPERGYSPVCGGDIEGSCAVARTQQRRSPWPDFASAFAALSALWLRARGRRRSSPTGNRRR